MPKSTIFLLMQAPEVSVLASCHCWNRFVSLVYSGNECCHLKGITNWGILQCLLTVNHFYVTFNKYHCYGIVVLHFSYNKGLFTLLPKVERALNSINQVARKSKIELSGFTLETKVQRPLPSKVPTWQHFLWVLAPMQWTLEGELGRPRMESQFALERPSIYFLCVYYTTYSQPKTLTLDMNWI